MKNANTFPAGFQALANPQHLLGGGSPWINAPVHSDPTNSLTGTGDDTETDRPKG